ncbi:MAG: glycosyltransferase, partial [Mucilaginibacter polytrichastri]|nr:glycosyltransferase [Mucilaginibacter polytrichastri]
WMKTSVKRSALLNNRTIEVIPNTLETDIFHPSQRVTSDNFIMLSGFMPSRLDSHKGTSYLLEALQIFASMPGVDPQQVELRIFGNRQEVEIDSPFRITFMGVIKNDEQLAQTYASADAFLAPSLEDNLPYTVMESLACGTPVVAFTTGGIPDMVKHQQNGYLAQYRSAEDLARGMHWIYQQKNNDTIRSNARETIMNGFSEQVIAEKHIALYRKVLEERNA